jgi:hypothetical protein
MRDHLRAERTTSALAMATQRQRPGAGLVHQSDSKCAPASWSWAA